MDRRKALLIFGFLALVVVIALVATADETEEQEDHGTRAGETYVGSEECNSCKHGTSTEEYLNWSETPHGIDFSNWDYHGTPTNKYTYGDGNDTTGMTGSCAPCHVVGFNQTDIGGFDPAEPWNSTNNSKVLRIGCENCHGPGSAHIGTTSPSDINLGLDRYAEACAGTAEAGCHSGYRQWGNDTLDGWNTSLHAPHDNDPATDSGMNSYCASCKSPSQWDPSATRDTGVDIAKEDYRGITCGDCHDPHPDPADTHEYQLKWEVEDSCDACHNGGHHETMRTETLSSTPSVDREDYPYMEEVTCVECHMWSSPRDLQGTIYEKVGHSFEPSIDACLECHSTIFEDIPEIDTDPLNWTAWEDDYAEVYEEWEHVVESAQDRHDEEIEEVELLLEEVEELMETAEEHGLLTEEIEDIFDQAEYDYELGEHASRGAHNPAYAEALLDAAAEGFEEVIEELSEGMLMGNVTDSPGPLADVYIMVGDYITTTAADGTYSLHLEAGIYTVKAFKEGVIDNSTEVVIEEASITWKNFTLAEDNDLDGTPDSTDTDDDNDGYSDTIEETEGTDPMDPSSKPVDTDKDGTPDSTDTDDDSDGYLDTADDFPLNPQEWMDTDDDNIGDNADTDDDGDGVADTEDADPWDPTVTAAKAEKEEADTTMYLVAIIVLIVVIALLFVMMLKKGGSKPSLPPEEPPEEPPMEEEIEEEEE